MGIRVAGSSSEVMGMRALCVLGASMSRPNIPIGVFAGTSGPLQGQTGYQGLFSASWQGGLCSYYPSAAPPFALPLLWLDFFRSGERRRGSKWIP